jgi:diacylglycerol kinase family enzyme
VRIKTFGGVVQHLAPGASLDRDDIRLVFCETGSRLAYLAYVTGSMLRRTWNIPGIERAYSTTARCDYAANAPSTEARQKIYVEADGELLGSLPAEFTIVPDALTVLGPER